MKDLMTNISRHKIRLTKEFSFEMAHVLTGYDGACSEIHGHSYRLFVTVSGYPNDDPADPKYGMVMDFRTLKKIVGGNIVDVYDHSLLIRNAKENEALINTLREQFGKIMVTAWQPTCENLVIHFAELLKGLLPQGVALHSLKLHETATSYAEWYASDNAG